MRKTKRGSLAITRLGSRGQLTIRAEYRQALALASDAALVLIPVGDALVVARLFQLVLWPYVETEVERALLNRLARDTAEGTRLIDDYALALSLLAPECMERISPKESLPTAP
jgi:hypothetical protein